MTQEIVNPDVKLYCIGCGRAMTTFGVVSRSAWSMSCNCGAYSPILVIDLDKAERDESLPLPASLFMVINGDRPPSHFEYHLGFSDFKCPAKDFWEGYLTWLGFTWMKHCQNAGCQRQVTRELKRIEWEKHLRGD